MSRVLTLLLLVCAAPVAPAATLKQLSLDEMTTAATSVVHAKVAGSSASFTGSTIYTHYKLQVSEIIKGSASPEAVVPGGIAGNYRQSFPGVPELQQGVDYVLFLWTSPSGVTQIIGFSQGIFNVSQLADGTAQASRDQIGETMLDSQGRAVQDHAIRMTLNDLKAQVRRTVAAGAAK